MMAAEDVADILQSGPLVCRIRSCKGVGSQTRILPGVDAQACEVVSADSGRREKRIVLWRTSLVAWYFSCGKRAEPRSSPGEAEIKLG